MGGSNQSLFLIGALFAGQDAIHGQGSAAVPLLIVGIILSWAALPGWTELVLLSPNRVGGIAAACTEAFRPYSSLLSALVGCCYWWGWVPTCGLTAHPLGLGAARLGAARRYRRPAGDRDHRRLSWREPVRRALGGAPRRADRRRVRRAHVPGRLHPDRDRARGLARATSFRLTTPFPGWFGSLTSMMAGLYLIGFAAPAFEAAACHVGETVDPERNVPRAMFASAAMAGVYFIVLPVVFLGVLGPAALGRDLAHELGPAFAPVFGSLAKALAIGFMVFNMFHGTLQPLAGASRTLSQLADDGSFRAFSRAARRATSVGGDRPYGRRGDRVSAHRRSDLADRGGELHLPDRDLSAQHRGLAAAPRCAGTPNASIARRAGRSGSGLCAAGVLGDLGDLRLRTVRPGRP